MVRLAGKVAFITGVVAALAVPPLNALPRKAQKS